MTDEFERLRARDEHLAQWAVGEIETLRQRVKETDDFISQLADHTQAVEAELIKWQNGELRIKSKSPYLAGELDGHTYPGLGHIPAKQEPFGFITTDHAGCEVFTKTRFKLKGHEQFPVFTSAPTIPAGWPALDAFLQKREQDSFSCKQLVGDLRDLLSAAPKPGEPT